MKKSNLKVHSFLATLFVFVVIGILGLIAVNFKVLDPFEKAFRDFDFTDIYYSNFRKKQNNFNTDIAIVNYGNYQRDSIAILLSRINSQHPSVIGVDVVFKDKKKVSCDSSLKAVLNEIKNPITTYIFRDSADLFSKKVFNDNYFGRFTEGYSKFIGNDNATSTIRSYKPTVKTNEGTFNSFSVAVAYAADSNKCKQFLQRGYDSEYIHYIGDHNSFNCIEATDSRISDMNSQFLKNKIVLVGYMGHSIYAIPDLEDNHFTPMNNEISGRTFPDMYGVVIHANIISMILNAEYIDVAPKWLIWLIAFLLCYIHIIFFMYMDVKNFKWAFIVGKTIQFVSSALFIWLSFLCYHYFNYKISFLLAIASIILAIDLIYFYEGFVLFFKRKKKK